MAERITINKNDGSWGNQVNAGHGRDGQIKLQESRYGTLEVLDAKGISHRVNTGSLIDYLNKQHGAKLSKGFLWIGRDGDDKILAAFKHHVLKDQEPIQQPETNSSKTQEPEKPIQQPKTDSSPTQEPQKAALYEVPKSQNGTEGDSEEEVSHSDGENQASLIDKPQEEEGEFYELSDDGDDEDIPIVEDLEYVDKDDYLLNNDAANTIMGNIRYDFKQVGNKIELTDKGEKKVSEKTRLFLQRLKEDLQPLNLKMVQTVDNGDCFFDAFAKSLNYCINRGVTSPKKRKEFTLQDLRKIVSDYAQKLPSDNWVKESMKESFRKENSEIEYNFDNYENWKNNIGKDWAQSKGAPEWGTPIIDGSILCKHFKISLIMVSETPLNEEVNSVKELLDEENRVREDIDHISSDKYNPDKEIVLVNYPGHFLATVPRE